MGDNVAAGHTPRAFSLAALAGEVGSLARSLARFSTEDFYTHIHTRLLTRELTDQLRARVLARPRRSGGAVKTRTVKLNHTYKQTDRQTSIGH